jgi:hypothetical protein
LGHAERRQITPLAHGFRIFVEPALHGFEGIVSKNWSSIPAL